MPLQTAFRSPKKWSGFLKCVTRNVFHTRKIVTLTAKENGNSLSGLVGNRHQDDRFTFALSKLLLSIASVCDVTSSCIKSIICRADAAKLIWTLRNYNGDGKENVKKAVGLMSKTTTLHVHHAFLYISLLSLHNHDVKWPNFRFTWEQERRGDKFCHLCLNPGAVPSLQLQPKFPSFK